LALNKSVILPEFGALSITNEETGEAMFNAYLKFNDGKLEKYIAEQEGIEKQDAANMVAKYVRDLELLLNKGETYDIFQFGRFIKRQDGSFDFENWAAFSEEGSSTYIALKTDKKEPSIDTSDVSEPNEVKKEHITEEELSSIKEVYEKPAERTLTEDEKKQSQNKFVPSETKIEKTESTSTPESDTATETEVVIEQPKPVKKQDKTKKEKTQKKRSVFFFPLILLILLLGVAGALVGIFPDEAKKLVGWEDVEVLKETKELQDTANQEEVEVETNEAEPTADEIVYEEEITNEIAEGFSDNENNMNDPQENLEPPVEIKPVTEGNYHIIVGSFGEKQNAENLVNSLIAKGHPAQIVGPVNNLHMVSFGAYPSRNAAQENLQKAITETGGGWILKR